MTRTPHDLDDRELAAALRDLGDHLDLGQGTSAEGRAALVTGVLDRLDDAATLATLATPATSEIDRRTPRRPRLLVAAMVAVALGLGLIAVAPAREAIADWFGVDGLRLTRTDSTAPAPDDLDPDRTALPGGEDPVDVAQLAGRLPFPLLLPSRTVAGAPLDARIDPAVPSGLIEVRYRDFTLVALASKPGAGPVLSKEVGPATTVEAVTVDGRPGLWLTGAPHQVSFIDPDGEVVLDSVRRAGDVLIWQRDGVTYRVEGCTSLDAALEVATALG